MNRYWDEPLTINTKVGIICQKIHLYLILTPSRMSFSKACRMMFQTWHWRILKAAFGNKGLQTPVSFLG